MNRRTGAHTGTGQSPPTTGGERPRVLVLASDALFPFFFPEANIARLDKVAQWERYAGRADSPRLRDMIARSDALITTWHSPFLRAEMVADAWRLGLIAHCGGEVRARVEEALF